MATRVFALYATWDAGKITITMDGARLCERAVNLPARRGRPDEGGPSS